MGPTETAERTGNPHGLMALLYLACVVSYVDRQLIALLLSDIQRDLRLEDWQLGFVSGTAFAAFYIAMGIPLSRLADRSNRVRMLGICLVAWSVMTALCGMAMNFIHLALARVGVATGEAGAYPTSLSLISDIYPPENRATMTALFFSGTTAGALVALIAGGFLNELVGWRWTFVIAAVPGILLAIALAFRREPRRGLFDSASVVAQDVPPSLFGALRLLFGNRFYAACAIAMAVFNVNLFSITVWSPTYALRNFGLTTAQVGLGLGLALGIGSGIVMIATGRIGDLLARRSNVAPLLVAAGGQLASIPLLYLALTTTRFDMFCILFAIAYGAMACGGAMVVTSTQAVVPSRLRGVAATLIVMLATLAGLGLGPMLVGLFSDLMPGGGPADSLRQALLAGMIFNVAGTVALLIAVRIRRRDPVVVAATA